jgi:hypothetical protein
MKHIVIGNVTLTQQPRGREQVPFVGTLDQIIEDVITAAALGAEGVVIDLNLQDCFTDTRRMLDTAMEVHRRATGAGG